MKNLMRLCVAALLTLGGLLVASPAQAEVPTEGNVDVFHTKGCGYIAITVAPNQWVGDTWQYGILVLKGSEVIGNVFTNGAQGPKVEKFKFGEDEGDGSVEVTYFLTDATEWDIVPAELNYKSTYPEVGDKKIVETVKTDCLPEPPAEEPPAEEPPAEEPPAEEPPAEEPPAEEEPAVVPYEKCDEAPGPHGADDPRWNPKLDADKDGVACEDKTEKPTEVGTLPVTGSSLAPLVGVGSGLVVLGIMLAVAYRSRRDHDHA